MASNYPCKIRKGLVVPWGYEVSQEDPSLFLPIDEQLDALEEAKKYIKQGCSYRDTAKWLVATTGRQLTHVALFYILKKEEKEKRSRRAREAWEKRFGTEEGSATEAEK